MNHNVSKWLHYYLPKMFCVMTPVNGFDVYIPRRLCTIASVRGGWASQCSNYVNNGRNGM